MDVRIERGDDSAGRITAAPEVALEGFEIGDLDIARHKIADVR